MLLKDDDTSKDFKKINKHNQLSNLDNLNYFDYLLIIPL